MKIVADNTVPYLKGIAEPIAEVKYLTSKEFTPENVKDADILICLLYTSPSPRD